METWYPGMMSYRQWRQERSYEKDLKNALNQQANQIVANQAQVRQTVSARLDKIGEINSTGFKNVVNAIESLKADFNYSMGLLLQELEIQSGILKTISYTLKNPLKTQVEEYYNDGCRLVQEYILDKAIQKFSRAIEIDDTSFLCYYQLGLLFLNGKSEDENVIDLKKANELLLMACRLGKGKAKKDSKFKPVIANTLFFTSLSYYFQVTGIEDENLNNAIRFAEESLQYNPNLSQSYYQLGKYYSLKGQVDEMESNVRQAIMLDRNYALEVNNEKTFDKNREKINVLLKELRDKKEVEANNILVSAKGISTILSEYDISETIYEDPYLEIKRDLDNAVNNYDSKTYFGYIDSILLSNALLQRGNRLLAELKIYTETLKSKKTSGILTSIWLAIWFSIGIGLLGFFIGLIINVLGWIFRPDTAFEFYSYIVGLCTFIGFIIGIFVGNNKGQEDYEDYIYDNKRR